MNWFKEYAKDFPTLGAGAIIGLFLLLAFGLTVNVRMAIGKVMPDGYDFWIMALLGLAGVTTAGMWAKRATDRELAQIKAGGPTPVTAEAGATVKVEAAKPDPRPSERGDE